MSKHSRLLLRFFDFLALAAAFCLAAHWAPALSGSVPAPRFPGIQDLLLLLPLGLTWHLAARATGLYGESGGPARTAAALVKSVLSQLLAVAVILFLLAAPAPGRVFALLYAAWALALTVAVRSAGYAWSRARRLPLRYRVPAVGGGAVVAAALIYLLFPAKPLRPDIILISIDTLRADRLGCYGGPAATSPNLDAFSRESVQFMQAISQAPSTAASHMSLFTGMLPPVHRVTNGMLDRRTFQRLELGLPAAIPTLAEYLKENGYRTAGFHGGGNVSALLGFNRGFDVYENIPWEHLAKSSAAVNRIRRWLMHGKNEPKPFFLFLHNYICHDPYLQDPPEFRKRFLTAPVPGLQEELERLAPLGMRATRKFNVIRKDWWDSIDGSNAAHRRHVRDLYDAGVGYADFVLEKIFNFLKRRRLYDRSLIIVTSDHGEQFWEHGNHGHEGWLFIETLHVPLLVKFPGGDSGGRKITSLVGLSDVMPTVLDYLSISPRVKPQANSLLPLIRAKRSATPPVISFHEGLATFRIGLGAYAYSNQPFMAQRELLFDHASDPGEQRNLAGRQANVLARMRAAAALVRKDNPFIRKRMPPRNQD